MSTNAKVGIAVGALVALVFVVTVVSQLPKPPDERKGGEANLPAAGLAFAFDTLRYEPTSERAALREYPQYFEPGDQTAAFWVFNPNPLPVKVTFAQTSCGMCSFADLAVVKDPPATADVLSGPLGAVLGGVGPRAADEAEYRARRRAEERIPADDWHRLKAANSSRPDVTGEPFVEVPAAAAAAKPTWVVVRLNIRVSSAKVYEATFACKPDGADVAVPMTLKAAVVPVEPCEVYPTAFDFQAVAEDAPALERTVFFWSATRPVGPAGVAGVLPPPAPPAGDGHLTFTPPVPATPAEVADLARALDHDGKSPRRVAGAYKMTLRFARTVTAGGVTKEADLGPFERVLSIGRQVARDDGGDPIGDGIVQTQVPAVTVKATLLGAVALDRGDKIELGSFRTRDGLEKEVVVVSDRPGLELEAVPKETTPSYLKVEPALAAERKGDHTRWTLKLKIDPDLGGGEIARGSVVVLRIKGTGQLVRIPVTGRGVG